MSSFADPEVSNTVVDAVVGELESSSEYPWDVIAAVEVSEGVEKESVRKVIRKLKMEKKIVPAEPFVGKIELAN